MSRSLCAFLTPPAVGEFSCICDLMVHWGAANILDNDGSLGAVQCANR